MSKWKEQALCYRFEAEKYEAARAALRPLGVACRALPEESWRETVGFLLGLRGFAPAQAGGDETFEHPEEVMIFHGLRGGRLDRALAALRAAGVEPVRFKAVVTPYNTFWTLRRLTETMRREHRAMTEKEAHDGEGA